MNCTEVRQLLSAWHDGELDQARHTAVEQHLQGCEGCERELRALADVGLVLRQDLRAEVPEGAAERAFRTAIRAEPAAPSFLEALFPVAWPTALASATVALVMVGWSVLAQPATQVSVQVSAQITDTALFEQALGTSLSQPVHGMFEQVLGVEVETSSSRGAG